MKQPLIVSILSPEEVSFIMGKAAMLRSQEMQELRYDILSLCKTIHHIRGTESEYFKQLDHEMSNLFQGYST